MEPVYIILSEIDCNLDSDDRIEYVKHENDSQLKSVKYAVLKIVLLICTPAGTLIVHNVCDVMW